MRTASLLCCALVAMSFGASAAQAQSLRNAEPPAEFPPSSYEGKQYVDSRGCIYVRAGLDGAVRWVPRVTRDRKHICGARPTLANANQAPASAPASKQAMAPKPARKTATITPKRNGATSTNASAGATSRVAALDAPAKPTMRKPVIPAQKMRGQRRSPVVQGGCENLSPLSRRYMGNDPDIRCGPQAISPVTPGGEQGARAAPVAGQRGNPARGVRIVQGTRIVPRHVHEQQLQSADLDGPPDGYSPVWEDDRLNRARAHQTLTGKRSMDARWTRTVPRQLKPAQLRAGAVVFDPGSARIVPATQPRARISTKSQAPQSVAIRSEAATPRVSTKTSAPERKMRNATHRYVQVAHFSDPSAMRQAAGKLRAAGLSVRVGRYSRGGVPHQLVLAGPYDSETELHAALSVAQQTGFGGARLGK